MNHVGKDLVMIRILNKGKAMALATGEAVVVVEVEVEATIAGTNKGPRRTITQMILEK